MGMFIGAMSVAFTGVCLRAGAGEVVQEAVLASPGGRWGAFFAVMFIYFILGFFIEWIGIFFIMVPILAPIAPVLGFDPLWFGMMICINLQMSFLTPPMAPAIFYLRGAVSAELEINIMHIVKGVIPFVLLIIIGLSICIIFPEIITWLPDQMIK
jgi:TRAP-type mannitol/chloroaromatic compound transport system permease large subunit